MDRAPGPGLVLVLAAQLLLGATGTLAEPPAPWFRDATRSAGLRFQHSQGSFILNMPETMAPGAALFDLDGDGLLELFFVQGSGPLNGRAASTVPPAELYRNRGNGGFDEVAGAAGLDVHCWGMGCLVVDLDNDGYPDVLVTTYCGGILLYRNNGDGTFRAAPRELGLASDRGWSSSATAIDFNRDGLLDVYVGHYLNYRPEDWQHDPRVQQFERVRDHIFPRTMAPQPFGTTGKSLFLNQLPRPFCDVAEPLGATNPGTKGLGALAVDFDRDGWTDLFVANDTTPTTLLHNLAGRRFEDRGDRAYVSEVKGSMGLALADVQGDQAMDVIVTRWVNETTALYSNLWRARQRSRGIVFAERGTVAGLGATDPKNVGWATAFLDLDNDGAEDLFILNGDTNYGPTEGKLGPQLPQLFRCDGPLRFLPVKPAGPEDPLARPRVGRGAAFGDLDRDGSTDIVICSNNGPGELLMARSPGRSWIGLELEGTLSNRDALPSRVTLQWDGRSHVRELVSGESYFSTSARQLLFGLGSQEQAVKALVAWPSGLEEAFAGLSVRRYHRLVEGAGVAVAGARTLN